MILTDPDLESDPALKKTSAARGGARGTRLKTSELKLPSARSLARFLKAAQEAVRLKGQVTVLLTTDAAIAKLNRRFRGKNTATDVLSFPAAGLGAEGIAGDLAISVTTALRQAAGQGHGLAAEIKVLILHGVLHLAGFDHETDEGQMARRERALRGKLRLPMGLIERGAAGDFPQGLKPRTSSGQSSARLKSCPVTKLASGTARLKSSPFKTARTRAKTEAAKGDERFSGAKAHRSSKQAFRGLKAPAPSSKSVTSAPAPSSKCVTSAPAPSSKSLTPAPAPSDRSVNPNKNGSSHNIGSSHKNAFSKKKVGFLRGKRA